MAEKEEGGVLCRETSTVLILQEQSRRFHVGLAGCLKSKTYQIVEETREERKVLSGEIGQY